MASGDFPDKLNSAFKALELLREWCYQNESEISITVNICIEGDPFYAFYIVKDLLATRTNFRLTIDSSLLESKDYMVQKFRQFVVETASLDFSELSSELTLDYPSSFTKCFSNDCRHEEKNFLSNNEKLLSISVIIPTRNVTNVWLDKLLAQATDQMSSLDELILIDDNDIERV